MTQPARQEQALVPLNSEEAHVPLSPEGWRVPSNPEEVHERLNPELMAVKRAAAKLERPKEQAALGKLQEQLVDTKPNVRLRPVQSSTSASPEYPEDANYPMNKLELLLMEILGPDVDFVRTFLSHLAEACTHGGLVDDKKLNFVFSAIKLQKPRDPLAVMAVAQAAMLFAANTKVKQDFDDAETPEQRQSAHRALNQGVRTYMSTIGELKRYQTGNEQRIVVQRQQNVSVSEGGQAIVGQVNHASATQEQLAPPEAPPVVPAITHADAVPMPILAETKQSEPVPALSIKDPTDGYRAPAQHRADALEPALRRQDAFRRALPVTGGARQKALSHARRRRGIRRSSRQPKRAEAWLLYRREIGHAEALPPSHA